MMVINQQMHTIIKNIQANYCLRLGFAALKFEVQSITARCVGVGGSGRQSHTEYVAQNQRLDYIRMQDHTAYARAASPHTLFSIFFARTAQVTDLIWFDCKTTRARWESKGI